MRRTRSFLLTFVLLLLSGIIILIPLTISRCGLANGLSSRAFQVNPDKLKGENFPDTLDNYRRRNLKRLENVVYMDYAKESVFSDSQFAEFKYDLNTHLYGNTHSESPSATLSSSEVQKARKFLINYFGITQLTDYIVVFTYSHAQALKVIAESFPFTNKSKFYYSTSSSNNILGLRGFAEGKGAKTEAFNISGKTPKDFEENSFNMISFPLVDEFTGEVLSIEKMKKIIKKSNSSANYTATLVDASTYMANHKLDLKEVPFSAIAISFDKIFGFPNLGAAIISGKLVPLLKKPYFGGGTLVFAMPNQNYEKMRLKPSEKLEDGSLPFLSIASLKYGFGLMNDLGFDDTCLFQSEMGQRLYKGIKGITYDNNNPATVMYGPENIETIITFNILDENGKIIDYRKVVNAALEKNITLAGGCMSTPGSCHSSIGVKDEEAGAIRASVGWATTMADVDTVIQFIKSFIKK